MQRKHLIESSERCYQPRELRTPSIDGQILTAAELSLRFAVERRHDSGTELASKVDRVLELEREHGGRCPNCGERATGVVCELCHSLLWQGVETLEPRGHVSTKDLRAAGVQ